MQLTLDSNHVATMINAYDPGGNIMIGNQCYKESIIVDAKTIIRHWPPQCYKDLTEGHLLVIFKQKPEVVLLGTGEYHQLIPQSLLQRFLCANIGVEVMSTAAACRTFNVLMSEGRQAVAELLIK